jgi:hypothetical protein
MEYALVIKFLKDNWKPIAGVLTTLLIILAANMYLDHVFAQGEQKGIEDTTKLWSAKYNKDVKALNGKIAEVELDSKNNAEIARIKLDTANFKIDNLLKEIDKQRNKYDQYVYDQKGRRICGSETSGPIYLGPDFSTEWNILNKGALQ